MTDNSLSIKPKRLLCCISCSVLAVFFLINLHDFELFLTEIAALPPSLPVSVHEIASTAAEVMEQMAPPMVITAVEAWVPKEPVNVTVSPNAPNVIKF